MEPNVSGGIFDGLLASLIKIGFDKTKIDFAKMELGISSLIDGLEPAVSSPGNLDAVVFGAIKDMLKNLLAEWKKELNPSPGPLVVGYKFRRTREEVDKIITDNGMSPTEFAPWILLVAQFIPLVIDLLKWLRSMKG